MSSGCAPQMAAVKAQMKQMAPILLFDFMASHILLENALSGTVQGRHAVWSIRTWGWLAGNLQRPPALREGRPWRLGVYSKSENHEISNFVLRHTHVLSRPRRGPEQRQTGPSHLCSRHPSLAEKGYRHPIDRGRQAVPGAVRRTAQQQRHQPRVYEAGMAQARRDQTQ